MGLNTSKKDSLPNSISNSAAKELVVNLNKIFEQNRYALKLSITFNTKKILFSNSDWKKSMVPANILSPSKNQYSAALMMKQVYKMHETLQYFDTKMKQSQTLTPSAITPDEDLQCCICLQKSPTMMLPCYHEFCDKCTEDHIIQKEEKKCPICRRQFVCGRESLKEQIFTIIDDQKQVIEEVQQIILGIIGELNGEASKKIKEELYKKAGAPLAQMHEEH